MDKLKPLAWNVVDGADEVWSGPYLDRTDAVFALNELVLKAPDAGGFRLQPLYPTPSSSLPLTDTNLELLAAAIWATTGGDYYLWERTDEAVRWLRTVCSALASKP